jgi:membrane fusion protein (multidrug efflux system)
VLLLPVGAVLGGQGSQAVFVVDDNTAVRRTVTTGLTSQGRIEIVSGLDEGDQVVVVGNNSLRDGMTVRTAGSPPVGPPEIVPTSTSDAPAPAAAPREGRGNE